MNKRKVYYLFKISQFFIFLFILSFFLLKKNEYKYKENNQKNIPKVSIFLPIYNKHQYLVRSVGSILNQTLKDIEIITVNDASTDNTLKELKKLAKKDIRIKIVNNDRNHGLLYSRAMGILNCTGEYIMNLDPDDRLEGIDNLEVLYNTSKSSDLDFLRYLVKIIPLTKEDIEGAENFNKNQFNIIDYLITNKFIKKKTILSAYEIFKNKIYRNKWNYHEDNIWNGLIRKNANNFSNINKFIYIYKMNNQSLMINKNEFEIKNRLYLMQAFQDFDIKLYNMYLFFQGTIRRCSKIFLRDIEIKNKFIGIAINLFKQYFNDKDAYKNINYLVTEILHNKIIIFNSPFNNLFEKYFFQSSIYKLLSEKYNKNIISVNMNNIGQINDILNFIFPNDILIGLDDIIFNSRFNSIINSYPDNKIIIFCQNINESIVDSNINLTNNSNIIVYSFDNKCYELLKNIVNKEKLFFYPNFILHLSNFFNYKNSLANNSILIVFESNLSYIEQTKIENIIMKYYENLNYLKTIENINLNSLIEIIQSNQLILTDNTLLMELSAIYFTSCILFMNNKKIESNILLINKLDYIKYIYNFDDLENNIIKLKKLDNNFDRTIFRSLNEFT